MKDIIEASLVATMKPSKLRSSAQISVEVVSDVEAQIHPMSKFLDLERPSRIWSFV